MEFWTDPFIESLTLEQTHLYLYLITSPKTNNLGILNITKQRIMFETKLSEIQLEKALSFLISAGKVAEVDGYIWLTKFIKNQTTMSPKLLISLDRMIDNIDSPRLKNLIISTYQTTFPKKELVEIPPEEEPIPQEEVSVQPPYGVDGVSIPHAYPINTPRCIGSGSGRGIGRGNKIKIYCASETQSTAPEPGAESVFEPPPQSQILTLPVDVVDEMSIAEKEKERVTDGFFDDFWKLYPRKADKKKARKAFGNVFKKVKKRDEYRKILDNMGEYLSLYIREVEGREQQYIKLGATWLNAQDFSCPPDNPEIIDEKPKPEFYPVELPPEEEELQRLENERIEREFDERKKPGYNRWGAREVKLENAEGV